jgi:phosphomannomutase/phosphoglucomutase
MTIFKACDIRGRYGAELTVETAEALGWAIGGDLAGRRVAVGGDVRVSTPALKEALLRGLMGAGCHAIDFGILPTPAYYFGLRAVAADGGVMVTASHNPASDNGFKITLGPWPITAEQLAALAQRMAAGARAPAAGSYQAVDIVPAYEAFLADRFAPPGQPLRVAVDAGNGSYSIIAPRVLRQAGYDVVELFCQPDGRFPSRAPNPAVAANLAALQETIQHSRADLGAAFDGDGDRVVFVDEQGRVVENDRAIVLLARHVLRRTPGEVIYDIKCSSAVPEGILAAGGAPVMEKAGYTFIKTALLQRGAVFAGEISGHFFFRELGGDDGLYAALLMLEVLAAEGRGLGALADSVPRYPITPDLRLPCAPAEAEAIVADLAAHFAQQAVCQVSRLDGVRIAWPDGWALARPSVTEPLITVRYEAKTEPRLAEIQRLVKAACPRLAALT